MRRPLIFTVWVLIGVGIDQLSKWLVFGQLPTNESFQIIPGILQFTHATNTGVAFSLLKGFPTLILCISTIATILIVGIYKSTWRTAPPLVIAALGLLLIGAIGNLIDRVFLHAVRDFIDFVPQIPIFERRWAIFNIADACITTGVFFYLMSELTFKGGAKQLYQRAAAPQPDRDANAKS